MEKTNYAPGTPSWVDIGVADMDAAMAFYGGLFGWTFEEGDPEARGYRQARLRDRAVAGFGPQMNPGPPVWTTYVTVADAAATEATVAEAGGTVVMPVMDVMGLGHMGIYQDPTGAFFSTWQAGTHPGAGLVNEPGSFCWNELATRDPDAAKAFYADVFGWGAQDNPMGPDEVYTEWQLDGASVGGMMRLNEQFPPEMPPYWLVYFSVADADAAVAKVGDLGGATVMPPFDSPAGRIGIVTDPAGATFGVIALSGEM